MTKYKYIQYTYNNKELNYITEYGIEEDFGLTNHEKVTKLIDQLAHDFRDYKYPASINMTDEKEDPWPNSPEVYAGKSNRLIKGILCDVWEMYYGLSVANEGKVDYNQIQKIIDENPNDLQIEELIDVFKDAHVKVGKNRDMGNALLEVLIKQSQELKKANDDYQKLMDSIVVRKNVLDIPYENMINDMDEEKDPNNVTVNPFSSKSENDRLIKKMKKDIQDHPYVTDEDGEQYQEFKEWLDADPKHKPILPD